MYNIHPTDFLIFSFDREVSQSKVLFQCPQFGITLFHITQFAIQTFQGPSDNFYFLPYFIHYFREFNGRIRMMEHELQIFYLLIRNHRSSSK